MSPRGKEQRRHDRVPGRVTLRTVATDLASSEMETDNLSLGGAYCLSHHSIPIMTRLRLNIFLPSSDGRKAQLHYPIEVDAVVVRSEPLKGHTAAEPGQSAPPRETASGASMSNTPVVIDTHAKSGTAGGGVEKETAARRANGNHTHAYRLALFFAAMDDADRQTLARYLGVSKN
ncbi:MAG: hypothetical protein ACE5ID_00815 [Acidobacteriota bacterium]